MSLLGRKCKCENVCLDFRFEEEGDLLDLLSAGRECQSQDAEQPDALLHRVIVGQRAGERRDI